MIIVDEALAERAEDDNPIRYGLFGAGFMARGILNQERYTKGVRCSVICSRRPEPAMEAAAAAGIADPVVVSSAAQLDEVVASGAMAVTSDPSMVAAAETIECIVEATGHVDYGANAVSSSIAGGKHVVLLNAELDGTIGPLLKARAEQAGVVYSGSDGDQPAVQMNLYRFVRTIGLEPLVCGNIKGLQDRYRNPTTQEQFAKRWGQTPSMVTSFADGTKISFEQAIVANATGMVVERRGMRGIDFDGHVDELTRTYDVDELRASGGVVDYVVGASPGPGVYVFAAARDETQELYLDYGKLGEGPLYSFYVPYHLTVFEVPLSVARAVDFNDAAISPIGGPVVDVIAAAKVDLGKGDTLDGLGGYSTYGLCENHEVVRAEGLLPMGLAEGSILRRDIPRDSLIRAEDVEYPGGTVIHDLRREQDQLFDEGRALSRSSGHSQ